MVKNNLLSKTYLFFKDKNSELVRDYNELINLIEGDRIKLEEPFDGLVKIRSGNYVVKKRTYPDRMVLNNISAGNADTLSRYYLLERETEK